jgi:hypothetical protein
MFFGRKNPISFTLVAKVLAIALFLVLSGAWSQEAKACAAALEADPALLDQWNSAEAGLQGLTANAFSAASIGGVAGIDAVNSAQEEACKTMLAVATQIPCVLMPAGLSSVLDCQLRDSCVEAAKKQCTHAASISGATYNVDKLVQNATMKDKVREALAFAFKTSLKMFTRQIAHDAAVWVASGGRGQKPLFITEGWGAYVQNAADNALGNFIDGIGQTFGVDLCQPDFRVKLLIQTSLNYNQATKARCSLTKIINNWESAISSASFSVDYRNSMRPGENDISFYLQMADQRNSYVGAEATKAAKEAETTGLWTNIKNVAGKILTPGTMIADTFRDKTADSNTTLGWSTFTNTAADMVEEFVNTLVSQLLTNLQAGIFANSSSGGGTGKNWGDLLNAAQDLANLFNYNSSPILTGTRGATEKFLGLITNREKVGNKFDLLVSLAKCAEADKTNPGPTDCVIDTTFSQAIKSRTYTKDLPENILSRVFSPIINQTNSLETEIPYRSVLILRKYRIVPVGWETAATKIKENDIKSANSDGSRGETLKKNWTLKEVMDCYYGSPTNGCQTNDFKGLVDPHWLLKAYEAFCRRQGFGEQNKDFGSLDGSINRSEYCADEQQCLFDDNKGNCQAYGYCSEERRLWDLGTSCDVRNNTCQTYKSRSGSSASLLDNTLDFSNCGSGNVGCQSYATDFNLAGLTWNGEFIDGNDMKIYEPSASGETIAIGTGAEWRVDEYKNVSRNKQLKISQTCSQEVCANPLSNCTFVTSTNPRYCDFRYRTEFNPATGNWTNLNNNFCQVAPGGVACFVEACYGSANKISTLNPGFDVAEASAAFNAKNWTDENSYLNINNRHLRTTTQKKAGSASLQILGAAGLADLKTTLDNIPVTKNTNYIVRFFAMGSISNELVKVYVTNGVGDTVDNLVSSGYTFAGNYGSEWKEYSFQFSSGDNEKISLIIKSSAGTIANFYLDEFKISEMTSQCQKSVSLRLFTGLTGVAESKNNIYLDRDATTCASGDDGCSMFLRNKAGIGGNLIYNGGFEHGLDSWGPDLMTNNIGGALVTSTNSFVRSIAVDDNDYYVLSLSASQELSGNGKTFVGEMKLLADDGAVLTVNSTNCATSTDAISLEFAPSGNGDSYDRRFCWFRAPKNSVAVQFRPHVKESDSRMFLDNVKLEKVTLLALNTATVADYPYSQYEGSARPANQVAYLKKGPDYFKCYKTATGLWPKNVFELNTVLANQDPMCSTYAPVCLKQEVGCEAYTPKNGDPLVPGIVDNLDLCPSECVGYQVYKQEATNFVSSAFKQFIADKNAKYCSASYAGCDEFTNLDELGQGAEKKEYYVSFRTCQKPATDDGVYYTWEGSDTTGYQLKSFTLKKTNIDNSSAPCTNLEYFSSSSVGSIKGTDWSYGGIDTESIVGTPGQNYCDDIDGDVAGLTGEIKNSYGICTQAEMVSNSDCREFYDTNGNVTYRLLSMTVSVSNNCHPYRRTRTQTTADLAGSDCVASHGYFNANAECIYMAIPNEGKTCSAAVKGCRAYTGNRGNNVREVFATYDFNSGTTTDIFWVDSTGAKDGLTISYESTFPGGNSLTNKPDNNIIKHQVGIRKNKSYTVGFWAKADTQSFYLEDLKFDSAGTDKANYFTYSRVAGESLVKDRVLITTGWNYYELGPVFVNWDPTTDPDYLIFKLPELSSVPGTYQKIYLDNIVLKETANNIYAIENSWFTPVSCDNKLDDPDGTKAKTAGTCQEIASGRCATGEMLGCSAYTDRFKNNWSLRSFSSLCRQEAVGCEALIDTFNSDLPAASTYNAGLDIGNQDVDKVTVPADQTIYMVNRSEYACQSANKGCQAVGWPIIDKWDDVLDYQTIFVKNDPDRYATDLCRHSELWCEQFTSADSVKYFKDPHGKYCQYGQPKAGSSVGWYIAGTELPCQATTTQSFGTGYEPSNVKSQPVGLVNNITGAVNGGYNGWAGTCSETQSGCSEYVDPLAYIYTNQILSRQCLNSDGTSSSTCNNIRFKANTLYSYSLNNNNSVYSGEPDLSFTTTGDCPAPITTIGTEDKKLLGGKFFYIDAPGQTDCYYNITKVNGGNFDFTKDIQAGGDKIVIAGVYYALKNSVDRTSCSGVADFNSSCVLFNERNNIDYSITPSNDAETIKKRFYDYLTYDASATFANNMRTGGVAKAVDPVYNASGGDSNLVLKANPDRTCKTWLSCTTYEKTNPGDKSPYFSINDRCLETKACDYLDENGQCGNYPTIDDNYSTAVSTNANVTGFASPFFKSFGEMKQIGESAEVVNGNFENVFGNTTQPLGWQLGTFVCESSAACGVGYPNDVSVVPWRKEFFSLERGNANAYEGTGYLKLAGASVAISEMIDFDGANSNANYILSAYVKTNNLIGEGADANHPWSELRLRFLDGNGNVLGDSQGELDSIAMIGADGQPSGSLMTKNFGWFYAPQTLKAAIGQEWQHLNLGFRVPTGAKSLQLALINLNPDPDKGIDNTKLGGYSLWDNVTIKPVLNNASGSQIERACRAYPSSNSVSCRYSGSSNQYVGQYGYCLLSDPSNLKQCLQWWPVDSIKGEAMSDFTSYYSERYPLYYCLEKKNYEVDLNSAMAKSGAAGQGAADSGFGGNFLFSRLGEIQTSAFNPDAGWAPLFKYPFVYRFDFIGAIVGMGTTASHKPIFGLLNATMYPKVVCAGGVSWGVGLITQLFGGGTIPPGCFRIGEVGTTTSSVIGKLAHCKRDETIACTIDSYSCPGKEIDFARCNDGSLTGVAGNCDNPIIACNAGSAGFFDKLEEWFSGVFEDIGNGINKVVAFLIGTGTSDLLTLNSDDVWGGWGTIGTMVDISNFIIVFHLEFPWHTMLNFKNSFLGTLLSGLANNKIFVVTGGMKIVTDQDTKYAGNFTDPDPARKGDVLGFVHYWDLGSSANFGDKTGGGLLGGVVSSKIKVEYCSKLVQVVNSSGNNRAWSARLSSGSSYKTSDADCVLDSLKDNVRNATGGYASSSGDGCFYASDYCTYKKGIVGTGEPAGVCNENTVNSYIGRNSDLVKNSAGQTLTCSGVNNDQDAKIVGENITDRDYFCEDSEYVFRKIYSYNGYGYLNTDYKPYGSIVAPANGQYPTEWDTRPGTEGRQPVYYETPFGSAAPYQARMGQVHTKDNLKQLFAKSYGVWEWNDIKTGPIQAISSMLYGMNSYGAYSKITNEDWSLPANYCQIAGVETSTRTGVSDSYCKIRPRFDGGTPKLADFSMYSITGANPVSLQFSVVANSEQLPIKFYEVNWGDGNLSSYSGISMLNRPSSTVPFTLYHYYDYYSVLKNCSSAVVAGCTCTANTCTITPSVTVSDNWGATSTANLDRTIVVTK